MKWPWVARHRVEHLERELKYKAIALQHGEREIDDLIKTRDDALDACGQYQEQIEQMRKEFAGDLQLERSRYDEFVRDTLDRVMGSPVAAARRASSEQEPALPNEVQSAIEEVSFGNSSLEAHLEKEARRRLALNEKPDRVAELIRAGESPA